MVTGGYWLDSSSGHWVQAGSGVLDHIRSHPVDARLLGLVPEKKFKCGSLTLAPLPTRQIGQPKPKRPKPLVWAQTNAAKLAPHLPAQPGAWNPAVSVVTQTGDSAALGDEVLLQNLVCPNLFDVPALPSLDLSHPLQNQSERPVLVSLVELLSSDSPADHPSLALVRESVLQPGRHPTLEMPMIERTGQFRLVRPEVCYLSPHHRVAALMLKM